MKHSKLLFVCTGALLVGSLASCGSAGAGEYTYRSYTSALATNWNPHTWETNADDSALGYVSEGFVSLTAKDTKNGVCQWAYDMAESVTDVTKAKKDDLTTFGVNLGTNAEDGSLVTADQYIASLGEGNDGQVVYQIKLRDGLKWEDGTAINADSFVESFKYLLEPNLQNYRANLYYSGESAVAGGFNYYYQGKKLYLDNSEAELVKSDDDVELKDGVFVQKSNGFGVKLALNVALSYLSGNTLKDYVDYYKEQAFDMTTWAELEKVIGEDGFAPATSANVTLLKTLLNNSTGWGESADYWVNYIYAENEFPAMSFDKVGLYKVDDLTFNYVMATPLDWSQAMVSFTSSWLVKTDAYESLLKKDTTPWTTTYGTSVDTTFSYGPYRLDTLQTSKQMVYVRNENWWGWEKDSSGKLVSYTPFEVDGERRKQYNATKIVIDVMEPSAAKQSFEAGKLSEYSPTATELSSYTRSDSLYQVSETYTMSLFFNTNLDALKKMDETEGNKNSVVLTNTDFRKAFSLAIDRTEFVTATAAYTPAYAIMNDLYYYDVWNDPTSSYRASEPAMQAICNLYGVKWGENETYKTLKEAYQSITGYNLSEAKTLMKSACDALVEAGLYSKGEAIKIRIAMSAGEISSDLQSQIALLNKYINAAAADSGFGTITLEAVGNLKTRYADVPDGKFAIGYGAWGGAAFYPFRNFQVYCDPDTYSINEGACWDPTTEKLKIEFEYDGEAFSDEMSWQEWSGALTGNGKYANADNEIKLRITAIMEEKFLSKYYRIPLAGTTAAFLLGRQVSYYTDTYNIMYGFGGFRLMSFNYDDAEWDKYVSDHGGKIDYTIAEQLQQKNRWTQVKFLRLYNGGFKFSN